ncbi:MMB_0454 family protein [Mycoplasmopsis hyopharyngis]|uniref:MMB_0454 family protein n=1 Tax=Mycoplasmopsis hyopharyngis TaxID=29558 RepID=UPI003872D879
MNILSLNCGLNQIVNIHENAFLNIIDSAIKKHKNIKLISVPKIIFADDQSNISIFLNVKLKSLNKNLINSIQDLQNDLEDLINSTIGIKPTNIQIACLGLV